MGDGISPGGTSLVSDGVCGGDEHGYEHRVSTCASTNTREVASSVCCITSTLPTFSMSDVMCMHVWMSHLFLPFLTRHLSRPIIRGDGEMMSWYGYGCGGGCEGGCDGEHDASVGHVRRREREREREGEKRESEDVCNACLG